MVSDKSLAVILQKAARLPIALLLVPLLVVLIGGGNDAADATFTTWPEPVRASKREHAVISKSCAISFKRRRTDKVFILHHHLLYRSGSACRRGKFSKVCRSYAVNSKSGACTGPYFLGLHMVQSDLSLGWLLEGTDLKSADKWKIGDGSKYEPPILAYTTGGEAIIFENEDDILIVETVDWF